jgi:hypothetical protein
MARPLFRPRTNHQKLNPSRETVTFRSESDLHQPASPAAAGGCCVAGQGVQSRGPLRSIHPAARPPGHCSPAVALK